MNTEQKINVTGTGLSFVGTIASGISAGVVSAVAIPVCAAFGASLIASIASCVIGKLVDRGSISPLKGLVLTALCVAVSIAVSLVVAFLLGANPAFLIASGVIALAIGAMHLVAAARRHCNPTEYPTDATTVQDAPTVVPQIPQPNPSNPQRTAQSLAAKLAPIVRNQPQLENLFGNKATYIYRLYLALDKYAQTGNMNDSISWGSSECAIIKDVFAAVTTDTFNALVSEIKELSNPQAKPMAKHLRAIQQWASRLTSKTH